MSAFLNPTVMWLTWRQLVARRRLWFALAFSLTPALFTLVFLVVADDGNASRAGFYQGMLREVVIGTILPLAAVIFGTTAFGGEVDDAARNYIEARGYGPYFLHRTGHSIGYEVHGNGVNIDNLETRDLRTLIPGVCFSIEPGIYLPEFGVRSEVDMFVSASGAEVTGQIQRDLLLLA